MWPWEHLVFGYLLYSALVHISGRFPRDYPTLALVFGTQFPDLVDKPLAWTLGILVSGRSLTHSLLTAGLLLATLYLVSRRYNHSALAGAFAVGYLSHVAGDALSVVLSGEYYYLGFLAWPLVPAYPDSEGFIGHLSDFDVTAFSPLELGFAGVVVGIWIIDGLPGLAPLLTAPRRVYRRLSTN